MKVFLALLTIGAWALGAYVVVYANKESHSAIHEIEGLLCFLIGTVAMVGVGVITAIEGKAAAVAAAGHPAPDRTSGDNPVY